MNADEAMKEMVAVIDNVCSTIDFHHLHHAFDKVREAVTQERMQYIRRIAELEAINEDHRRSVADAYMQRPTFDNVAYQGVKEGRG